MEDFLFQDAGSMCSLNKMATVLEGGREFLKLRDVGAAVCVSGMPSSSTPNIHLLPPVHPAAFLHWEGKAGAMDPFWKESSCNYFLSCIWSSS